LLIFRISDILTSLSGLVQLGTYSLAYEGEMCFQLCKLAKNDIFFCFNDIQKCNIFKISIVGWWPEGATNPLFFTLLKTTEQKSRLGIEKIQFQITKTNAKSHRFSPKR
jgi:hypothetical protein